MRRGEIWWGEQPPPVGRQPFLIISNNALNEARSVVIVVSITTHTRDVWTEVAVGDEEGLRRESVIDLGTVLTVPKASLFYQAGELVDVKMLRVEAILASILDLSDSAVG